MIRDIPFSLFFDSSVSVALAAYRSHPMRTATLVDVNRSPNSSVWSSFVESIVRCTGFEINERSLHRKRLAPRKNRLQFRDVCVSGCIIIIEALLYAIRSKEFQNIRFGQTRRDTLIERYMITFQLLSSLCAAVRVPFYQM